MTISLWWWWRFHCDDDDDDGGGDDDDDDDDDDAATDDDDADDADNDDYADALQCCIQYRVIVDCLIKAPECLCLRRFVLTCIFNALKYKQSHCLFYEQS